MKPAVLGCEQSSVILAHENAFSADSWIQSFKVPRREWGNFLIFEAWKCDFAQSWNPSFKGTKFRVNKFSAFSHPENAISLIRETIVSRYLAKIVESSTFLRPENAFLPSLEIHVSRVPSFVWANFRYYGILKMIFLLIRETNFARYLAKSVEIFFIFKIHVSSVPRFVSANFSHVRSLV